MDIYVEWQGTWVCLTDNTIAALMSYTGLGLAPGKHITMRSAQQQGETYVTRALQPRTIQLVFRAWGDGLAAVETVRDQLQQYLGWRSTIFPLRVVTPGGKTRQIDVMYAGGLDNAMEAPMRNFQAVSVSLLAFDPTFYDPTMVTIQPSAPSGTGMDVPSPVPTDIGSDVFDEVVTCLYTGTEYTFPHNISIVGPVADPCITNNATGYKLDFTGTTLSAGEWLRVDCRFDQKTVVDQAGADQIALLTADSDLDLFAIAPAPDVTDGNNPIWFQGTGADSNASMSLSFYTRYHSI